MPSTRRAAVKAKAALKLTSRSSSSPEPQDEFEKHFYGHLKTSSRESEEDSGSEYDIRSRAKGKRTRQSKWVYERESFESMLPRQREPEVPQMSDMEIEDLRDEDGSLFIKRPKLTQRVARISQRQNLICIQIPPGVSTINLDLGGLLKALSRKGSDDRIDDESELDESTLFEDPQRGSLRPMPSTASSNFATFLDLGPELRNKIYRLVLKDDVPIELNRDPANCLSSALLRSCQSVHREAAGILYGENSFHFERQNKSRGQYWDKEWQEVGYKDIRRFLEDIGPSNRSCLRHVSLELSDAVLYLTPKLDTQERRFVNDPVVLQVLRLIASSGTVLTTFAVGFVGRQNLKLDDMHFLRALCSIRCHRFVHVTSTFRLSKISDHLLGKIRELMEVPNEEVNQDKERRSVRMKHDEANAKSALKQFDW